MTAPSVAKHIKTIVEQISNLKFHEVAILNEVLKKELNIPDIPIVASQAVAVNTSDDQPKQIKTSFTVKLTKFDDNKKVSLIKEIKKLVEGINLVQAKRFVEECPKVIKSDVSKTEAEDLQKKLEAAGAVIVLE